MSDCDKVFDPSVTGVAGLVTSPESTGGGNGGGGSLAAGTYYSRPTWVGGSPGVCVMTDVLDTTGTLAGTLTYEVSNASDIQVRSGTDKWSVYTRIAAITLSGVQSDNIEFTELAFTRVRTKIVITAGAGTVLLQRTVKRT